MDSDIADRYIGCDIAVYYWVMSVFFHLSCLIVCCVYWEAEV